jgi:hypothetical protein
MYGHSHTGIGAIVLTLVAGAKVGFTLTYLRGDDESQPRIVIV